MQRRLLKSIVTAGIILAVPAFFALAQSTGNSSGVPDPTPEGSLSSTTTPSAPVTPKNPAPTGTVTPKPAPSENTITTSQSDIPASAVPASNATNFLPLISAVVAFLIGVLGMVGLKTMQNNTQDNNQDNKCSNIKDLLEQKKQELLDLGKERLKEKALEAVGEEGVMGKVLAIVAEAKEKYEKLQVAIEVLEKQYTLCELSLPEAGGKSWQGVVVEQSLQDKEILKNFEITKNYKVGEMAANEVLVNEKQIKKIGEQLQDGPWHMYFSKLNADEAIVVFKDKTFEIKPSDKNTWKEAIEYAKLKGISDLQLNVKHGDN